MRNVGKAVLIGALLMPLIGLGDAREAFCILPLFEAMFQVSGGTNLLPDAVVQEQINKLKLQVGPGGQYFETGFSGILRDEGNIERNFRMAHENGISLGLIISNVQTHALPGTIKALLNADIRRYQWRQNGVDWYGVSSTDGEGSILYPSRDFNRITDSRYATGVRAAYEAHARDQAAFLLAMDRNYPGVLAVVNAAIEEEQPTQGGISDDYLGDYSPFAVTEFRDWLRHAGKYDAATGGFAGEGAPAGIVGDYLLIDGYWRSPFSDDPSPADANGTGISFNNRFGTSFTTWSLRYYDLAAFPAAIPYATGMEDPASGNFFDISPESGTGFTVGGFDAPRVRNISNPYWLAWSWDMLDHDPVKPGEYPPGDPRHPQFGFRQTMVRNWCTDVLDWARDEGIPAELLHAHQIPAEIVSASRLRSSASPAWTGYYATGKTVGITRFGLVDPDLVQRYARRWGIFEWHPRPWNANSGASYATDLYNDTITSLNSYYWTGARVLFPGWWTHDGTVANGGTFPLADSSFADGMRNWLAARADNPPPSMGSGSGLDEAPVGSTVRLTGWIQPFYSETHLFTSSATLTLNGVAVPNGTPVSLQAGQLYPVVVEYTQGQVLQLDWSSASMPQLPVPLSQLYPAGDTDGDGTDDVDEVIAGRDARDAGDLAFHFNTDGDAEGWALPDQLTSIAVTGGVYTAVSTGNDPKLQRNSGFSFDTREVPGFLVRMKSDQPGRVDLFFGNATANYAGTRLLTANLLETNVWQHLYLSATNVAEWGNFTVTKIRFDPTTLSNATFAIDWIRATDGDLDDDGIADTAEPTGDTDGDGMLDVLDSDSDGDGFPDAVEHLAGSDPYDARNIPADLPTNVFTDTFNSSAAEDINADAASRQTGALVPASYTGIQTWFKIAGSKLSQTGGGEIILAANLAGHIVGKDFELSFTQAMLATSNWTSVYMVSANENTRSSSRLGFHMWGAASTLAFTIYGGTGTAGANYAGVNITDAAMDSLWQANFGTNFEKSDEHFVQFISTAGTGGTNTCDFVVDGVTVSTRTYAFTEDTTRQIRLVSTIANGSTTTGATYDNLAITVPPTGVLPSYGAWAAANGLVGDAALRTADVDLPAPDGMDNLLEYALGGDPNVADADAVLPTGRVVESGGSNVFEYVYNRRHDDSRLTFGLLVDTDLVADPAWSNIGTSAEVAAGATADPAIESVTNRIPATEDQKFVGLEVIEN
ncbi:MAG: thrombospondin type 3 repeat-containing protein [Kiritimatiellales bacterium]|nr:thrombospondin type 3 repeat-containing protein [Kiritimatiellales bacterium]